MSYDEWQEHVELHDRGPHDPRYHLPPGAIVAMLKSTLKCTWCGRLFIAEIKDDEIPTVCSDICAGLLRRGQA